MIITCSNCATKFNLPDAHVRPGAKVKCSVCEQVFAITPDQEEPREPEAEPQGFSMEDLSAGPPDGDEFTVPESGGVEDFGFASDDDELGFGGNDFESEFGEDLESQLSLGDSSDPGPEVDDLFDTPSLEDDGGFHFDDDGGGDGDDLFSGSDMDSGTPEGSAGTDDMFADAGDDSDDLFAQEFGSDDSSFEDMTAGGQADPVEDTDISDLFNAGDDVDATELFNQPDPAPDPAPAPDRAPRGRGEPLLDSEPPPDAAPDKILDEEEILGDDGALNFDLDKKGPGRKKKKRPGKKASSSKGSSSVGKLFMLLLLLVAFCGVVLYMVAPETLSFLGLSEEPAGPEQPAIGPAEDIFIELRDVRQFVVENDVLGMLCVIQGVAVNNYDVPKELIMVEVDLLDAAGQSVANQRMLIGNTVTLYQLKRLSAEELEAALTNPVNIVTQNTNVPPGGEVPFEIVFINPPDTVTEFHLRVVDFKDPPKE